MNTFKGLSKKRAHLQRTLGGLGRQPSCSLAPEGLKKSVTNLTKDSIFFIFHQFIKFEVLRLILFLPNSSLKYSYDKDVRAGSQRVQLTIQ